MSKAESDTLARGPSVSLSVAAGVVEVWDGRGREPPRSCIGDTNCSSMIALGSLRPLRTSLDDDSFSPVRAESGVVLEREGGSLLVLNICEAC